MPDTPLLRAAAWLIRTGAGFVPAWRRDGWRREWLGELHFAAARLAADRCLTLRAQTRLLARCAGAAWHVRFIWHREWSLDMVLQDVRYGCRLLRHRPAFTTAAVLTLALGVGATTTVFTAVNAVLLRPLPYRQPERLVRVSGLDAVRKNRPSSGNLSVPDVLDFARASRTLDALGAYNSGGYFTLTGAGEPERVPRLLVTSEYFRVLDVTPLLGRLFRADEDRPGPPAEVVISYGFWQRRFGGDPAIVGRTITLSGVSGPIIGVTPKTFTHPDPKIEAAPDVFALLDPDEQVSSRSGRFVKAIGRLSDHASTAQASAELEAIAAQLAAAYPASDTGKSAVVEPLADVVRGEAAGPLWLMQAATLAIVLIGCVNLANLLLGAASGRSMELSTRLALGADRGRLVRQLLTESLVLAAIGGACGVGLAFVSMGWLTRAAGHMLLPGQRLVVNFPVLAFAGLISLAVGTLFGLLPALRVSRAAAGINTSRRQTAGRPERRLRAVLVGSEAALSIPLLVAAMLLVRSFRQLTDVDPGFHASHVLSFQLSVQPSAYPPGQPSVFYDALYARLQQLPGVDAAAGINILPLSGNYSCDSIQIEGHEVAASQAPCAEARSVSVRYFDTMRIPLLGGRTFARTDDGHAPHVVVINEALAEKFYSGVDAVGRRLTYASRLQNDAREIVGIVGNVHHFGLDRTPVPEFYTPDAQPPAYGLMTVVLRASVDPTSLTAAARRVVHDLAPGAPVYDVRTLDAVLGESVSSERLRALLLTLFAGLAWLLAVVGVYGVTALAVGQRARELSIRLALGASQRAILRTVVLDGLRPVVVGLVIGGLASMGVARAIAGMLFQVGPLDPGTFLAAVALILASGTLASWIPARRAHRVDPASALRAE